jgi:hypothetical protein
MNADGASILNMEIKPEELKTDTPINTRQII